MAKDVIYRTSDSLAEVLAGSTPTTYTNHGPEGSWDEFLRMCGDCTDWDVPTALRALVAFVLGRAETPFVISMFHDSYRDDAPSYRLICYDVTYDQLLQLDSHAQPGWFQTVIEPAEGLFVVKLVPTRSLMKLLYKMVI